MCVRECECVRESQKERERKVSPQRVDQMQTEYNGVPLAQGGRNEPPLDRHTHVADFIYRNLKQTTIIRHLLAYNLQEVPQPFNYDCFECRLRKG